MLTSDSFCAGVEVLAWSLKHHGATRRLICLVTPQVGKHVRAKLSRACHELVEVPPIENPNEHVHVEGWVNSGYTKLHIFGLTAYSKLVYIDADCLVQRNVDDVRVCTLLSCASHCPRFEA